MTKHSFSLIVACTSTGGIGKNNTIPWYIPEDLKHFKEVTTRCLDGKMNAVVMGRNTWESLPKKPLPSRINVIVSSKLQDTTFNEHHKGHVLIARSLDEALGHLDNLPSLQDTFVIGGSRLYEEALLHPSCSKAYITHIHKHFECDTFISLDEIQKSFTSTQERLGCYNDIEYSFNTYLRN